MLRGRARIPPVLPGCGEKPSPDSATISEASAASAGREGGDGASGRWRRIWGMAAVDATDLGRLTATSRCGEKPSAVHVTPPRASGDSASSGEGISGAEDGRRYAGGRDRKKLALKVRVTKINK